MCHAVVEPVGNPRSCKVTAHCRGAGVRPGALLYPFHVGVGRFELAPSACGLMNPLGGPSGEPCMMRCLNSGLGTNKKKMLLFK